MGRPKQTLKPTYGLLTVVSEQPRNVVLTTCQCGTTKIVTRSNLRSGRVQSCGAPACRELNGQQRRGPKLGFPRWILPEAIPPLYAKKLRGTEATALAAEHNVSPNTMYNLLRKIEMMGGVEPYMEAMAALAKQQAIEAAPRVITPRKHEPVRVVVPGVVPPPPAGYRPRQVKP